MAFASLGLVMISMFLITMNMGVKADYYAIPTTDKYEWERAYPQGCECVESGANLEDCDLFKCTCACDITAAKCDYNCCCDPDCSSHQKERFKDLDTCSEERHEPNNIRMCYSDVELSKIVHRGEIKDTDVAEAAVTDALCVQTKNLYFEGEFHENTGVKSSTAIFDQSRGKKKYAYNDDYESLSVGEVYDQNDTIPAFVQNGTESTLQRAGFFSIPQADFSGYCNDQSYATFENELPVAYSGAFDDDNTFYNIAGKEKESACLREWNTKNASFEQQCVHEESLERYVSTLYLGAKVDASKSNSYSTGSSNFVPVEIASVQYLDSATQVLIDVTSNVADDDNTDTTGRCNTTYFETSGAYDDYADACKFATESWTGKVPFPICMNAIKSVRYVIYNSQDKYGSISKIEAYVILMDVPMQSEYASDDVNQVPIVTKQSFSLSWTDDSEGSQSRNKGNLARRRRSGNPGYIMGAPLLYGEKQSGSAYINEAVEGFTLPSALPLGPDSTLGNVPLGGSCPDIWGTGGYVQSGYVQVPFGYDTHSGCTVDLTLAQLEELCCTGNSNNGDCNSNKVYASDYVYSTGIPQFLSNNHTLDGRVGIYGNADPLDPAQWLSLSSTSNSNDDREWDAETNTCRDVFSGIKYEFLVAKTGERTFPQSKIIATKTSFITESWAWGRGSLSGSDTKKFSISSTVSYIFKSDGEISGYTPPPPPIIFNMPYDTFYPFDTRNSASRAGGPPATWLVVGVLAMVTLLASSFSVSR